MKRKLTIEEETSHSNKKSKTEPTPKPEKSPIVFQATMASEGKFAGKKITFRLREEESSGSESDFELESIPDYLMSMRGYGGRSLDVTNLQMQQREYVQTIAEKGSLELFDKKMKNLKEFLIKINHRFNWDNIIGLIDSFHDLSEENKNVIYWSVCNNRYDILDSICNHTVDIRNDYNKEIFIGKIIFALFKSNMLLKNILEIIDHYKPKTSSYAEFFNKVKSSVFSRYSLNIIENILIACSKDFEATQCSDYFNKIKWLAENIEPIKPGIIRRIIAECTRGSILQYYNEDTKKLFQWLLEQDKDTNGLFDIALDKSPKYLKFLIDNGLGPRELSLELVIRLGLFDKYKECLFLQEAAVKNNLLRIAIDSDVYHDSEQYFKMIYYMVRNQSELFIKSDASVILPIDVITKISRIAQELYDPSAPVSMQVDQAPSSSKEEKKDSVDNKSYWRMINDICCNMFEVCKSQSLNQNHLSDLCFAIGSLISIEYNRNKLLQYSVDILHAFIAMLKQKTNLAPDLLQYALSFLSSHAYFGINLTKDVLIELAKEGVDLTMAIISALGFPLPRDDGLASITPAKRLEMNLKFLVKDARIKECIKDKNILSVGMHLVPRCVGKEMIAIYHLFEELGGDYQWRLTSADLKHTDTINNFLIPGYTLLLEHIIGFVRYQISLNDRYICFNNIDMVEGNVKTYKKYYNEQKAFEVTQFLLEKKIDPNITFESSFKINGYSFKGNIFDYIAMQNRVANGQYLALHEQKFFRNENYRQAMQAACERADAQVLKGPDEKKSSVDVRPIQNNAIPANEVPAERKAAMGQLEQYLFQNAPELYNNIMRCNTLRGALGLPLIILDDAFAQQGLQPGVIPGFQHAPMPPQNGMVQAPLGYALPPGAVIQANGQAQMVPRQQALQQHPAQPRAPMPPNGIIQPQQPRAVAPKLLKIHEDKQNTHGKAVHQETADAAIRLIKTYFNFQSDPNYNSICASYFTEILKYYSDQVICDLKEALNKSHPVNHYANLTFREEKITSIIDAAKKHILSQSKSNSFLETRCDFIPELWDLSSFIAYRWFRCILIKIANWQEPISKVKLGDCLFAIWKALQDDKKCTNDKSSLLRLLTQRIVEIQHEYPALGQNGNEPKGHSPTCPSGAFNQLISTLEGQHPDVPIINRIRVGNLFDFIIGYYEDKFNQLSIEQKREYFKAILNKENNDYKEDTLPESFINDFEKGFYEKHKSDINKGYINEENIKQLFHNDYVPWTIAQFRIICEFIKKEIEAKKSSSQSSSNYVGPYVSTSNLGQQLAQPGYDPELLPDVALMAPLDNAAPVPMEDQHPLIAPQAEAVPMQVQEPALPQAVDQQHQIGPLVVPQNVAANPFGLFNQGQPETQQQNQQQHSQHNGHKQRY